MFYGYFLCPWVCSQPPCVGNFATWLPADENSAATWVLDSGAGARHCWGSTGARCCSMRPPGGRNPHILRITNGAGVPALGTIRDSELPPGAESGPKDLLYNDPHVPSAWTQLLQTTLASNPLCLNSGLQAQCAYAPSAASSLLQGQAQKEEQLDWN